MEAHAQRLPGASRRPQECKAAWVGRVSRGSEETRSGPQATRRNLRLFEGQWGAMEGFLGGGDSVKFASPEKVSRPRPLPS